MLARFKDWLHERRIRHLKEAMLQRPCVATWKAFREAVKARSAAQVERMERRKGLI